MPSKVISGGSTPLSIPTDEDRVIEIPAIKKPSLKMRNPADGYQQVLSVPDPEYRPALPPVEETDPQLEMFRAKFDIKDKRYRLCEVLCDTHSGFTLRSFCRSVGDSMCVDESYRVGGLGHQGAEQRRCASQFQNFRERFSGWVAIPWGVLLVLTVIYLLWRAGRMKDKSNRAIFMVPGTDGSESPYKQAGFKTSYWGLGLLACWIGYLVTLLFFQLFMATGTYNWFCIFGWTRDIYHALVGGFIFVMAQAFAILIPLCMFKQYISRLILEPCPLNEASLVIVAKYFGKKKVGDADGDENQDDDEDDDTSVDGVQQEGSDRILLDDDAESTTSATLTTAETATSKLENAANKKHIHTHFFKKFMLFLSRARNMMNGTVPLLKVKTHGLPASESYFNDIGVEYDDTQDVRSFSFMCLRYIWRPSLQRFDLWKLDNPNPTQVLEKINKGGMSDAEAHAAQQLCGPNKIKVPKTSFVWDCIMEFASPLYLINLCTIWSWLVYDGWNMAAVWMINLSFSGTFKVIINRRTKKKVQSIAEMEDPVKIYRNGKWKEFMTSDVVPGDVIMLEEGEKAPCDAVCAVGNCVMNESMLTGEPMPVLKFAVNPGEDVVDKKCMVYGGTEVLQSMGGPEHADGKCIAVATATAGQMMKGQVVRMVLYPVPLNFIFRTQLSVLYFFLVLWAILNVGLTIGLGDVGFWAVTVISGLSNFSYAINPSMDVTITWAETLSVGWLQRKGVSCLDPSRLVVAAKIHCAVFDKTGTITQETIDLKYVTCAQGGEFQGVEEIGSDNWRTSLCSVAETRYLLHIMGLCHAVTELEDGRVVGNSVEVSMWTASGWTLPDENGNSNPNRPKLIKDDKKKDDEEEDPHPYDHVNLDDVQVLRVLRFDHSRMTSGCIVEMKLPGIGQTAKVLLLKGSFDKVKGLCKQNTIPNDYDSYISQAAGNQEYILSAAIRVLPESMDYKNATRDDLEKDLNFVGVLHFSNELRPTSKKALTELREAGIRTCMCTGDCASTAIAVARKVGMLTTTIGAPPAHPVSGARPQQAIVDVDFEDKMTDAFKEAKLASQTNAKYFNRTVAGRGAGGVRGISSSHKDTEGSLGSASVHSEKKVFRTSNAYNQGSLSDAEDERSKRKTAQRPHTMLPMQAPNAVWNPSMHVIYGELKNGMMRWEHVDSHAAYTTDEVLELAVACPDFVEIILSGEAFMRIQEGNVTENDIPPMEHILPLVRITCRVTPAGKVAFVGSIANERNVIVGMVGDGGNDCGALREAHVGCAMSTAEASLVAPFASGSGSLESFCHIIAAGRCTLLTNKATTMWFLVMAIEVSLTHTLQIIVNVSQAEWVIIMIYLVFSIFVSFCIVQAAPIEKLSVPRPSARIFGPLFLTNLCWHLFIYGALSLVAWMILLTYDWYESCDQIRDIGGAFTKNQPYTARSFDFRSEMYTYIVLWHLIITACAVSFGGIFRRTIWRNFWMLLAVVGFCCFVLALLWSGPYGFGCVFASQCDVPGLLTTDPVVITQLSASAFGGCNYGAQICAENTFLADNGVEIIPPTPDNFCTFSPQGLMPFNQTSGSSFLDFSDSSFLEFEHESDRIHPGIGLPIPQNALVPGDYSLRKRDRHFASAFMQRMIAAQKDKDNNLLTRPRHTSRNKRKPEVRQLESSNEVVDHVDRESLAADIYKAVVINTISEEAEQQLQQTVLNEMLFNTEKQLEKAIRNKTMLNRISQDPPLSAGPNFTTWRGKYFAQFSIQDAASVGQPDEQVDYNLYYQIDEFGVNMVTGFADMTLNFATLNVSTDPLYPAGDGWLVFQTESLQYNNQTIRNYVRLKNGINQEGDIEIQLNLGEPGEPSDRTIGNGTAEKFSVIFFNNNPPFKTGALFGRDWCHGLNNCMDANYKKVLTVLLFVFAAIQFVGYYFIDRLSVMWNKNIRYFARI